jgi:NAD(P)-dependent dehydrogenase (short-subunit alcohol dehydrogenase family)
MTTATAERRPRLEGRTAIVTGAGTGIGQGIAVAMAKEGANIIIVGRTEATLQETSSRIEDIGGTVLPITGSVSEKDTPERVVAKAVEAFGRLDILVNNAHTFSPPLPLDQTPETDLRQHLESGFFGTFYFMQAAFPHMRERGGSIINFGSMAGGQGWADFSP